MKIELVDLCEIELPHDPSAEFDRIAAIASTGYAKLKEGGVLVHCAGGRGRTGTIIGAILRHCGHGPAEIIDFLDAAYCKAKNSGWPESPWQAQVVSRIQPPGQDPAPPREHH